MLVIILKLFADGSSKYKALRNLCCGVCNQIQHFHNCSRTTRATNLLHRCRRVIILPTKVISHKTKLEMEYAYNVEFLDVVVSIPKLIVFTKANSAYLHES